MLTISVAPLWGVLSWAALEYQFSAVLLGCAFFYLFVLHVLHELGGGSWRMVASTLVGIASGVTYANAMPGLTAICALCLLYILSVYLQN